MMKRLWIGSFLLLLPILAYAAPRTYGQWGTATQTNTTVTSTFNPSSGCITNEDAANYLYFNLSNGTAAATSGGSNFRLAAGQTYCWSTKDPNSYNTFVIGVICSAGQTAAFNVKLFRGQ